MRTGFAAVALVAAVILYLERRRVSAVLNEGAMPMERRDEHIDTLARTIWGEARGEGSLGMQAVANVVMNRVAFAQARGGYWWGDDVTEVCLKPWQFSVWNPGDPNRELLERVTADDSPIFVEAVRLATYAVDGQLDDVTGGATHYHTPAVSPNWISAPGAIRLASIGNHNFYRGIG
jgi:spore germination cell wall hydrolase CwlJ-like protein